jgi:hypothetical protein
MSLEGNGSGLAGGVSRSLGDESQQVGVQGWSCRHRSRRQRSRSLRGKTSLSGGTPLGWQNRLKVARGGGRRLHRRRRLLSRSSGRWCASRASRLRGSMPLGRTLVARLATTRQRHPSTYRSHSRRRNRGTRRRRGGGVGAQSGVLEDGGEARSETRRRYPSACSRIWKREEARQQA